MVQSHKTLSILMFCMLKGKDSLFLCLWCYSKYSLKKLITRFGNVKVTLNNFKKNTTTLKITPCFAH
jgi:hypothetical protein